ncbi:hypothetical protein PX52LOC_06908 [Limnoglobus roseus]|uniref:ArsR family transcriptional regulator n=1 Tax=Limnoglobus roseus TaxID=2598579 RepID=A0A5C1ANU8_9BACT|nr:hypothetical protein PX52LOC_06908 [Limnoglobus roseus]
MADAKRVLVPASWGDGRRELTQTLLATLRLLRSQGRGCTAADLSQAATTSRAAMHSRLVILEQYGLVASRRVGTSRVFRPTRRGAKAGS